jgi:hypothetical protein
LKRFLQSTALIVSLSVIAAVAVQLIWPKIEIELLDQTPKEINYLTGQEGTNKLLLAVKIDDTKEAHPQIGLKQADLVYVEQVEAGLTRLLAIYSSSLPDVIGPIRSARISDIDILAPFGRIAFAYSGSQTKMRPVLSAANLNLLSAERNPPSIFDRDKQRNSPVNMILYPSLLLKQAQERYKMELVTLTASPWSFGDLSKSAQDLDWAKISWPNATYEVRWNSDVKKWGIYFNDEVNLDSTNQQLMIDNAIIQNVKIEPSIYGDKFGGITPLSITTGSGSGYLLRDGKVVAINWQREAEDIFTRWFDANGDDMNLTPGKTWVFLSGSPVELGYPAK